MNIYELAKEAGVSIATVSRVVNGKSVVSKKTRDKVEAAMKKFDYTPSEIARGLVVNSMRTVGVMAVDIRDIYYANVAYTVEQELSKLGYTVILCNTGDDISEKIKYLNILKQKKVDGIILVGSVFRDASLDGSITSIAEKIPIVMINGKVEAKNVYSLVCDDAAGIEEAVDHLYNSGRKGIIYLQDTDTFSAKAKVEGFRRAMQKNGLIIDKDKVIKVEKGLEGASTAIKVLAARKIVYDALVCGDDLTAMGAVKYLQDNGVKVPEKVAVTGYNNSLLALCSCPGITSVDSRMLDIGKQAVEIFGRIMDGSRVPSNIIVRPELIIRDSG